MNSTIDTFLPPLEKPPNPIMSFVYAMSRKQFGKVLTPLKVHSARLPAAFGMFYNKIGQLDKKLTLPAETRMLVREHVARINQCLFCIDIGRYFAIQASMNQAKFDALEAYRTNPAFSEAERALLDYVGELTRDKHVDPETFRRMAGFYSEREICEAVSLVATEHVYNMTDIRLNIHADMLCEVAPRKPAA